MNKDLFSVKELVQPIIGSFTATLLFFALRSGEPLTINPWAALSISAMLLVVYYYGLTMRSKNANFALDAVISLGVTTLMAVVFGNTSFSELTISNLFSGSIIVGWWMAFPTALLFDKYDFTNPLKRNYVRGKNK